MPQFFFLWTPEGRVRLATLRAKRQRTFGAPTRFTPCCRIFHADRFALWENPQRSLRSLQLTAFVAVRFSVRIADGSPGRMAALSLHSFFGSRVKWPVRDAVGYMQPAASGGQKDIGMGRPLMWPLVFDTSAWRRAEGREIRRNFSKIYSELPRPVMCRQDPDRMVEF